MTDLATLETLSIREIMQRAFERHVVIPAFNVAYLPMLAPIAETLKTLRAFALVEVARPDIEYFGAEGYRPVAEEFARCADRRFCRLHQDHVPVVDEKHERVDWRPLINEALALHYDSVMIDGSRLGIDENIAVTRAVVEMAAGRAAVEAELGAVLGHEAGPLPPYEELFASGRGFTEVADAVRFVKESGVDWLSVAIGNIHGAITGAAKDEKKVTARLHTGRLREIAAAINLPLVLHGGSGIDIDCVREAIQNGIAKINVGSALRQAYEQALRAGADPHAAVARSVARHLEDYRAIGSADVLAK